MAQTVFYHLYNQVSYMSLNETSPLTFSIGKVLMRRISAVVASVLIFQMRVQPVNALGAAIAIFGTFLYSQVFFFFLSRFENIRLSYVCRLVAIKELSKGNSSDIVFHAYAGKEVKD